MNKKLYVGNLAWGVIGSDLADHFKKAGTVVTAVVIMDRDTGRSRGFGFVEMSTEDEARNAIETLSNTNLSNRPVVVREAKPEKSAVAPPPESEVPGVDVDGFPETTPETTPAFVQNIKDFVETATVGEEFGFDFADKRFTLTVRESA